MLPIMPRSLFIVWWRGCIDQNPEGIAHDIPEATDYSIGHRLRLMKQRVARLVKSVEVGLHGLPIFSVRRQ